MLRRFDMEYGTTGTKLEGWQRLCQDCGVRVGNSITQCKKVRLSSWAEIDGRLTVVESIVAAHINIVDLIQAKSRGHYPIHHPNRIALANYTLDNDKVFPKRIAQENGFLKALLVQMF